MLIEFFILIFLLLAGLSAFWSRKQIAAQTTSEADGRNCWYALKYILAVTLLSLRQRKLKKLREPRLDKFWKSINFFKHAESQESVQDLKQWSDKANDAVAFQGSDLNGNHVLVRIGRRANGRKEFWLCLRLANSSGGHEVFTHPEHPNTQMLEGTQTSEWTVEGLDCHMREPMRKWRVSYHGWLRMGIRSDYNQDKNQSSLVYAKFSFIWTSMSDVIDFNKDLHPRLVADALARETWSQTFFKDLQSMHEDRYEQWGQMTGSITIGEEEPRNLVLRGMRDHCYGERDWRKYQRYTANMGYCEDGTFFHVGAVAIPSTTKHLVYGYFGSFGDVTPVEYCSISLPLLGASGVPPQAFTLGFGAGKNQFLVRCNVEVQIPVYNGSKWESKSNLRFVDMELNGKPATGFSEFEYRMPHDFRPPHEILHLSPSSVAPRDWGSKTFPESWAGVIPLSHHGCTSEALVGGKAKQLAQLYQLQGSFSVPDGVCVSTQAFKTFLDENAAVKDALRAAAQSSVDRIKFNHIEECFASAKVPSSINLEISAQLDRIFGRTWKDMPFAVRSSAIGEDGAETSSAGQMHTFLGISGIEKIAEAIVKCWGSGFKEQGIRYRVQHGEAVTVDVAVVIQHLVHATVSGVIFTCDPVSGHPGNIVINASYGLGEAIVSGITEPDHIVVSVDYYDSNNLTISLKHLGLKSTRVLQDGNIVSSDEAENAECCLTEKQIIRLAKIAVEMKTVFGNHRDIEWAIAENDNIYLLQCRPVTTLNFESDYELIHEFDSPVYSIDDFSTTHNVGEVMGGAITPLGISVALLTVDHAIQYQMKYTGVAKNLHPDLMHVYTMHGGHVMLKLTETMYRDPGVAVNRRVSELCLLGQIIRDEHLDRILEERFKDYPKLKRVFLLSKLLKSFYGASKLKEECREAYKDYHFPESASTDPSQLLRAIENCFYDYFKVWHAHVINSGNSGFWYHLIMAILVKKEADWSSSTLQDVAAIYATCTDVESADVPTALQELSAAIKLESGSKHVSFDSMEPGEAVEWLVGSNSGRAGAEFKTFLSKHGHRCIHEIDLFERSWSEDPESIIPVLQRMMESDVGEAKRVKATSTPEHVLSKLNSQLTPVEK